MIVWRMGAMLQFEGIQQRADVVGNGGGTQLNKKTYILVS